MPKKSKADIYLANLAVENQTYLERLKAGYERDYSKVFPELEARISELFARTKVTGAIKDELTQKQLDKLLAELRKIQLELYSKANQELVDNLGVTGRWSVGKEVKDLEAGFKAPEGFEWSIPKPAATWKAIAETPIGATGELLKPFMDRITEGMMSKAENAVRKGYAEGKTIAEVTREIYGTKARNYKDGITLMNRRSVQAMVRTATQHSAITARADFFQENDDVVEGYTWISTLDGRTTSACRSKDSLVFQLGKGPLPPGHVGCRSSIAPKLSKEFEFLHEGETRSSENGYVDGNTTYYDWLKNQPQAKIDEVLGKGRGQLFRDGGLTPAKFSQYNVGRNFEPLSLDELYIKDPEPFRKAGVKPPNQQSIDDLVGDPVPFFRTLKAEDYETVFTAPTGEGVGSLHTYSSVWANQVNGYLRHGTNSSNTVIMRDVNGVIRDLDKVFSDAPMQDSVNLFRKVNLKPGPAKKLLTPGAEFVDRGYSSTSIIDDGFNTRSKDYMWTIKAPKGVNGAVPMKEYSKYKYEQEILLNRNSRFRVLEVDHEKKTATLEWLGLDAELDV